MKPVSSSLFLMLAFVCIFFSQLGFAQLPKIELLASGVNTNIRGLSVVDDHVVWVSGSNGVVGKTIDAGRTWKWIEVKGFEKNDFRDIEAFDAASAVIMSVGEPAYILKTNNGGESWKVVYENKTKGIFLDAMEFWNEQAGIVIGDPIEGKAASPTGRFFIARSFDGGSSWQQLPFDKSPLAEDGEACFAASGTNIRVLDRDEAIFVSGGSASRLFTKNGAEKLPIIQGNKTSGANSIAVWDHHKLNGGNRMIIVGGDFATDSSNKKNCFISYNGGKSWIAPKTGPHGYRSCVEYFSKTKVFCCGLTGIDYSSDNGNNWTLISNESFHVCRASKRGTAFYFAGTNGKIARVVWP